MVVNIRLCDEGDVGKVSEVLLGCGLAKTPESGPRMFLKETKNGDRYFIAEDGDKPVGVVSWEFHGELRHGLAELVHIGVVPSSQGKGVASLLFETCLEDAKKTYLELGGTLRKFFLLTHDSNDRARAFYEKMGMSHEITLKDHYKKDQGEYVYSIFFEVEDEA